MLTKEQILAKCQGKTIEDIRNINLWGCDLENVDVVSQFPNVEIISLSLNNIASLKPFSQCANLRELYLRKNKVTDINELNHLIACKELKILWLEENPICLHEEYKSKVLALLPQLIKLDNIPVQSEQQVLINDNNCNNKDNVEQVINSRETLTNTIGGDIQKPLRASHSALPKQTQRSNNNNNEDDYMKKFDNIDDIKNMFSQDVYGIGPTSENNGSNKNINNGLGFGPSGVNVAHSNPISTTMMTNMTLTNESNTNKKDYLVSETLLNAQQMKNNYAYPHNNPHLNPIKAFNNNNNNYHQLLPQYKSNHEEYSTPITAALNQRNNQYANDNMNYINFKQVPIHQEVPFEAKLAQYKHNLNPIPINDSLSNISPRNYHLMTAILNLIEDLSVKELAYVRNKIILQLNSSGHS